MRWTMCALTIAAVSLMAGPSAATAATTPAIPPVRDCSELVGDYDIPGAVTHVTEANEVGAEPRHCDVRGRVEPNVRFQLRLPLDTFTGRYLQYGCDGFCGGIREPAFRSCGGPNGGGTFAVAATDDGHQGQPPAFPLGDATWGASNQAARDDYFFRAPHVVSKAAKRIIAAFYGAPPRRSYFNGCSTGGREALLLAQRYPHDFDGIVAGAPVHYMAPWFGVNNAWVARANTDANGAPIITDAKLRDLQQAVLRACDRLDGLVDGQIDEPRVCRFDPASVQCPAGTDQPACLTPAQVAAARKLYAGATDARGRRLYPASEPPGAELQWTGFVTPVPGLGPFSAILGDGYLRHLGYPLGTPHSSVADFQFTVGELHRLTAEGAKGNAMSLDLREFRRSGGKLIMWHGWADANVPPQATIDYYDRLWRRNGGLHKTQEWARLFMVPTLAHCGLGGYRLNRFDPFDHIVAWVERNHAPDRIVATQEEAGTVVRSRPVFPHPARAKYDGTGSVDDAGNFVPGKPLVPPRPVRWAGEDLYDEPGPAAP